MELQGKTALVTGGTGALGTAVATTLLEAGANVVVTYRQQKEYDRLREEVRHHEAAGRLLAYKANVADAEEVETVVAGAVERFGRLDILVSIVGGFSYDPPVAELGDDAWARMFDVNLRPTFLACRAALKRMTPRRYGKIVTVGSRTGLAGGAHVAAYAASKAAVHVLTQSISDEVKGAGINVNCVLPATIDTPANRASMPNADFGAWVRPQEVASVVRFLVSDEASGVMGALVPVFGRG